MKLFSAIAISAVSLTGFAGNIIANSSFGEPQNVSESQKQAFTKTKLDFSGSKLPKYWTLSGPGRVSFENKKFTVDTDSEVLFYGKNYRISQGHIGKSDLRFTITATGTGSVTCGFYCYNARNIYVRTLKFEPELNFTPEKKELSVTVPNSEIPPVPNFAPRFIVKGKLEISKITCDTVKPNDNVKKKALIENRSGLPFKDLYSKDNDVRNKACYTLSLAGSKALPALEKLAEMVVRDPYEPARVHASAALCAIGPEAYDTIREILLGNNLQARLTIGSCVRGMKNGVPPELKEAVEWATPPVSLFNTSRLPDGDFEGSEGQKLSGWTVEFKDGATGNYSIDTKTCYRGEQSLKLTKSNGKGYIILKSNQPVTISSSDFSGAVTFRFFFKTHDSKYNTLLLPRLITESGGMLNDDSSINGGNGIESQSRIRNTPGHVWARRSIMYRVRKDYNRKFYPAIILYGNPATVWIDNVQFPAEPFRVHEAGPASPQTTVSMPEAEKIIAKRPEATAEVVRNSEGKLSLLVNGKPTAPVMYQSGSSEGGDVRFMHKKGGIQLSSAYIKPNGSTRYLPFGVPWDGKKVDYDMLFSGLEKAICKAPEASFLLGIQVMLPRDFVDKNPSEAWLNANGEKGYGNDIHMRKFGNLPDKSYFYWPSPYSEKAWTAAENMLRDVLTELKKRPYSKVIAGAFISGGHDGQFMIHRDDYSQPALNAWRTFLKKRYKTDAGLAKAWNMPSITFANVQIPQDVRNIPELQEQALFNPEKHRKFIDYREFKEAQIWLNADRFSKLFKEVFGQNKITMTYCMGGGWQKNFDTFYKSSFDGAVPQPSYADRLPGLSGGVEMPSETFRKHKKFVIAELDTRAWARCIYTEVMDMWVGVPYSKRQLQAQIMKDAGRQIAQGHGFWFYDIGSNTYRHPAAMEVIRKVREASDRIVRRHNSTGAFVPGAALVYHQKSVFYDVPFTHYCGNFASQVLDRMSKGLRRSGVPMTAYYLEDMMTDNRYEKHKIFVFMNAHMLTGEQRDFINSKLKKNGNVLIWIHDTGMLTGNSFNPELTGKLTGIKLRYNSTPRNYEVQKCEYKNALSKGLPQNMGAADVARRFYDFSSGDKNRYFAPCFDIVDKNALILGRFNDGGGAVGVKKFADWTSVFCSAPGGLDGELLHNLAKAANVYTVSTPGLICEVNSAFASLHSCVSGTYMVNLPRKTTTVKNAMTGKVIARNTDKVKLDLPAGTSMWLELE